MEAPRCCVSEIIEQGKWREGWRAEITQAFFFLPKMAPQHITSFAVLKALIKDTESSLQESSSPSMFSLLHPINVGKWLPTTECQIITGSPP